MIASPRLRGQIRGRGRLTKTGARFDDLARPEKVMTIQEHGADPGDPGGKPAALGRLGRRRALEEMCVVFICT